MHVELKITKCSKNLVLNQMIALASHSMRHHNYGKPAVSKILQLTGIGNHVCLNRLT